MPAIDIDLTGDHAAVGLRAGTDHKPIIHTISDWIVDPIEQGMQSGATSLMVIIPVVVNDVEALVMAETSLQCWMMVAAALAGKYPDEVQQPGWVKLSPAARAAIIPRYTEAIRRAIPTATAEQAEETAAMMLDALGADEPPAGGTPS